MISLSEIRLQQKPAILTLIYKVSYGGCLTIDGDSYMDNPGGYSEEGGILGPGEKSLPEY